MEGNRLTPLGIGQPSKESVENVIIPLIWRLVHNARPFQQDLRLKVRVVNK